MHVYVGVYLYTLTMHVDKCMCVNIYLYICILVYVMHTCIYFTKLEIKCAVWGVIYFNLYT